MGGISPPLRVTMPCRSESGSLPKAMSKRSFSRISPAIASGDEQSIRICPSLSTVIKAKVGSTFGLTTSRSSPYISAMGAQYGSEAPPIGSTPILSRAPVMAGISITCRRPAT